MKNTKYNTVGTIPKSNIKITEGVCYAEVYNIN
jgi:hypothetical protein